jgi:hypothetical protein
LGINRFWSTLSLGITETIGLSTRACLINLIPNGHHLQALMAIFNYKFSRGDWLMDQQFGVRKFVPCLCCLQLG